MKNFAAEVFIFHNYLALLAERPWNSGVLIILRFLIIKMLIVNRLSNFIECDGVNLS